MENLKLDIFYGVILILVVSLISLIVYIMNYKLKKNQEKQELLKQRKASEMRELEKEYLYKKFFLNSIKQLYSFDSLPKLIGNSIFFERDEIYRKEIELNTLKNVKNTSLTMHYLPIRIVDIELKEKKNENYSYIFYYEPLVDYIFEFSVSRLSENEYKLNSDIIGEIKVCDIYKVSAEFIDNLSGKENVKGFFYIGKDASFNDILKIQFL